MKKLLLLGIFSLCFASCKSPPPDVTPCLVEAQNLAARAQACNAEMRALNDPKCSIDIRTTFAHCSPVNSAKKPYDIAIYQMDKYVAQSYSDFGTLLGWINAHTQ